MGDYGNQGQLTAQLQQMQQQMLQMQQTIQARQDAAQQAAQQAALAQQEQQVQAVPIGERNLPRNVPTTRSAIRHIHPVRASWSDLSELPTKVAPSQSDYLKSLQPERPAQVARGLTGRDTKKRVGSDLLERLC
ncbi:hypothetical protein F2Q69_00035534 [Brassica cretica]|uniref:Uncharacterized protein n=1 Tax=Brassica cretica TaxID=69181 RepID=A0A8S9SMR9_BRACR|nr:hypothetical protein F2Q69_00035534 [Brassica cretica]